MSPPITLIASLPTFASQEEHAAIVGSTPASFADIPPVVKHIQPNVRVALDPPVPGFEDADAASGTLYVLTSVLVFWSSTNRGFQIPYPSITLHAISRAGPAPAIYCQLDAGPAPPASSSNNANGNEDEGEGDEGDEHYTGGDDDDADTLLQELSLIPQDSTSLDTIFEALSTCAALHPDPHNPDDDDNDTFGDDDAVVDPMRSPFDVFDGDAAQELSEVGRAALAHIESIIYDPFDHAHDNEDEDEEGAEVPPDFEEEPDEDEGKGEGADAFEDADEAEAGEGHAGEAKPTAISTTATAKPVSSTSTSA
ncbi:hypothetical protein H0H92_010831 [Tricholoma furcatifolium]|nr:hypothetical protein H0H92_010831 [Tricholoma furcatifolium]